MKKPLNRGPRGPYKKIRYVIKDQGYKTPCWIWQLSVDPKGYGQDSLIGGIRRGAHIVSYEKHKGPVPVGKELDHICHDPKTCVGGPKCPHRPCINPDHLEPVTDAVNSQRTTTTKLNLSDISDIKEMFSYGLNKRRLANLFDVDESTIRAIVIGKTWKNHGAD